MTIAQLPPQVVTVPAPGTTLEALQAMHQQNDAILVALARGMRVLELSQQPPEMRTLTINGGQNPNQYQVVDEAAWAAKSIGVLNPGNVPVFIGVGGVSARAASGAPSCPGSSSLVLPVEAADIEFGCDPAVLVGNSTTIYVFRYVTVQPLVLRQVP